MKIFAIHLLNDFSGSPKVLRQVLTVFTKQKYTVHLLTGSGRDGFLSGLENVTYHRFWYRFAANPITRFLFLLTSQFLLFFQLIFILKKEDVVYINTVLPFGAGLAGKLKGNRVIYHIHETSVRPRILKKFLFGIANFTANDVIYVSGFLANNEPLKVRRRVIYNAIDPEFVQQASVNRKIKKHHENLHPLVLMICSLKAYKGVFEFVKLAEMNPDVNFKLVLNASEDEIGIFFYGMKLPCNLIFYPTQTDTHPFYREADLVLNLSDPDRWIETFGLTILEAMVYGIPVIVPPVGGITELVDDCGTGFLIDPKNVELVSEKIAELLDDKSLYNEFSQRALAKSSQFYLEKFQFNLINLISKK